MYAIDRRGRGESGDVAERSSAGRPEADASGDAAEYELEREIEDVVAVVDSMGDPVNLLGHSFGALCALEAALRTDNLRTLILYEPAIPVGNHELHSEEVVTETGTLLDGGENERALVLFFTEIAEFPPSQLDTLRSASNWSARVEAAHTVLRETEVESEYTFDAARFEGITAPTLLLDR